MPFRTQLRVGHFIKVGDSEVHLLRTSKGSSYIEVDAPQEVKIEHQKRSDDKRRPKR